jgi:hypothetical protein
MLVEACDNRNDSTLVRLSRGRKILLDKMRRLIAFGKRVPKKIQNIARENTAFLRIILSQSASSTSVKFVLDGHAPPYCILYHA